MAKVGEVTENKPKVKLEVKEKFPLNPIVFYQGYAAKGEKRSFFIMPHNYVPESHVDNRQPKHLYIGDEYGNDLEDKGLVTHLEDLTPFEIYVFGVAKIIELNAEQKKKYINEYKPNK